MLEYGSWKTEVFWVVPSPQDEVSIITRKVIWYTNAGGQSVRDLGPFSILAHCFLMSVCAWTILLISFTCFHRRKFLDNQLLLNVLKLRSFHLDLFYKIHSWRYLCNLSLLPVRSYLRSSWTVPPYGGLYSLPSVIQWWCVEMYYICRREEDGVEWRMPPVAPLLCSAVLCSWPDILWSVCDKVGFFSLSLSRPVRTLVVEPFPLASMSL